MQLEVLSPEKKLFSGQVTSMLLPGTEGMFGILNNHAPMIAALKAGKVKVTLDKSGKEEIFVIAGGVVEVLKNKVTLLAE